MDASDRFLKLLKERDWTKSQLAKEADLSQSTIQSMMKRGNNPSMKTINQCCRAFGITLSEFFYDECQSSELSLVEQEIIFGYRELSPEMKKAVVGLISASKNCF